MSFKNISVYLRTNVRSFQTDMALASKSLIGVGRDADDMDGKLNRAGKGFTAGKIIAAGLAVALLAFGAMTKEAIAFERNMRNVNSISHLSEAALKNLGNEVLQLSTRLPQSAQNLSAGLYEIASSGFQAEAGVTVLTASAEAASAGLSTTDTAARAITASLNAYGLGADSATRVSDALFSTVNLGVVSFDELASTLGNYIGMAAAAKIPIEQVGAAIATMTLAGIPAAEAGTSLNRVIQSLIDPSDELSATLEQMGYATGQEALEAEGLHGVMMKLMGSTGGNLAVLIKLFPEIRAARGALALMSAEGRNYNKVFEQMGDENKNVGATKAALNEQMKGLGFQLDVLKNKGMAWGITMGMEIIPRIQTFIAMISGKQVAESALGKTFQDLVATGRNLAQILLTVASAVAPVVSGFVALAAAPVVATFRLIGAVLKTTTDFLVEHKGVTLALAGIYAATLVPSLMLTISTNASLVRSLGALIGQTVAWRVATVAAANPIQGLVGWMWKVEGAAGGMKAALAGAASGVLLFGAAATVAVLAKAWMDAASRARDYVDEIKKGAGDLKTITDYRMAINALTKETERLTSAETQNSVLRKGYITDLNGEKMSALDVILTRLKLRKETDGLSESYRNMSANYKLIAAEAGISVGAVQAFNTKIGADFTGSVNSSEAQRKQFIDSITKISTEAGVSTESLSRMLSDETVNPEALIADMEKVIEAAKGVGEAFTGATDILSKFGADTEVTKQGISDFYKETTASSKAFVDGIADLMERGLDPAMISRLLQAGPAEAGPLVQAMVSDTSGSVIKMVNDGEAALEQIQVRVVELARLTQTAINSASSEFSDKLPMAIRISELRLQGLNSIDIAAKLGMSISQVTAIADKFGIQIDQAGGKVDELNNKSANPKLTADDEDLNEKIRGGSKSLDDLDADEAVPLLKADDEDLNEKIRGGREMLRDIGDEKPTPKLDADPWSLSDKVRAAHLQLGGVHSHTATPAINANNADLNNKTSSSHGLLNGIAARTAWALINANNDDARRKTTDTHSFLNGLAGKVVTSVIKVVRQFIGFADGGYIPGQPFQSFANGTEDHRAHIAYSPRMFAEPETGGEAYIPLAPAKRGRSLPILSTVAHEFGYELVQRFANGGFSAFADGDYIPKVTAGAGWSSDPLALAGAVAAEVRRAMENLEGGVSIGELHMTAAYDLRNPDAAARAFLYDLKNELKTNARAHG